MRKPPGTLVDVAVGLRTPDTIASGSAPNTSSCVLTGNRLVSQQQILLRLATQAEPPSASAIAELVSSIARVLICQPP